MFTSSSSSGDASTGRPERKSSQNASNEPPYVVAQRARRRREVARVADLEQRVAGMRREAAEQVGAQQRRDHRAVAAGRLALDAAVPGARAACGKLRVDVRDELVAEIGVVVADRRRVEELRAADRGERVDEHDDRLGRERRDRSGIRRAPRLDVEPGVRHPRHALDHVDRRVAPRRRRRARRRAAAARADRRAGCRAAPRDVNDDVCQRSVR